MERMHRHERKICPRCNQSFDCTPGNITQCQCYGITIKPELKTFLEQRYNDCLCNNCLHTFNRKQIFLEKNILRNSFRHNFFEAVLINQGSFSLSSLQYPNNYLCGN